MAHPKSRHSNHRRNNRRSHDALSTPPASMCPQCGEPKRPHNVCLSCGFYKGKDVLETEEAD